MGGGGGDNGSGLHHTMVALKPQQFQYDLKKIFLRHLRRLVFPVFLGQVMASPLHSGGGGVANGGGNPKGGGVRYVLQ